jgi:hypothetical protein
MRLGVTDQQTVTKATRVLIDAKEVQGAPSAQFVAAKSTLVHPQYDGAMLAHDIGGRIGKPKRSGHR